MRSIFFSLTTPLIICALLGSTSPVLSAIDYADGQNSKTRHAISLYGEPKYPEGFEYFDYVNPNAPKGGELKQGVIGHFDSLIPYIDRGTAVAGSHMMHDTLLARSWDEPLTKYGLIAERIELAPDNTWAAFYINPKARFHDGKPVTADDVKFSFDLLREQGSTFYKQFYQDVEKVEVTGNDRALFVFRHSNNRELPLILGQMPILPKHFWAERDFSSPGMEIPLSSGPYKPVRIVPGRSITFARVENYWGKDLPVNRGRHNFDRIQYDYYRNSNVLLEALQKGEFDLKAVSDPRVWHNQIRDESLQKNQLTRSSLSNHNPQTLTITYNSRRAHLSDPRVREALGYAIEFDWINQHLFHGMYKRADSVFAGTELGASEKPSVQEQELLFTWKTEIPEVALHQAWVPPGDEPGITRRDRKRKALSLLQQSGWFIKKNKLINHNGQPLELEILLSSSEDERIFIPVQKMLESMGIRLNIRTVDVAQYVERVRNQDFDMVMHTFPHTPSPGTEQASLWGSGTVDLHGSRNIAGIKLESIDKLTEKIPRANSREELLILIKSMDRIILWNHYVLPLWYQPDWLVVHKKQLKYPNNPAHYALDLSTWWYCKD
ncbi:extracellular solute-binding protein [Endozoicomonas sp. SCSIO W0465]|uniref:extracellular solute-binding protein n=1 Tax=Endozoicomonas sp. SCSIO W0465 TaxID=2918516 RepID=UPI002074C6E4|nr:extracellular solute-binding protein [Endozoicomonas sp. SCSIO W0465]USE39491.1 extracellular solute-binding protein [Endozoicomonas sp. SCSIO W0465]